MRQKLTSLSLCILAFALSVTYSNAELKQAFHIIRHGARTPSSFEFKPEQYLETAGELTILGRMQHYHLGQEFRKRYVDNLQFLSRVFDPSEVLIKVSGKPRVISSAYSFVNGFYPQTSGVKFENLYKSASMLKTFLPLQTRHHKPTEADIMEIILDEDWAQKVIEIIPEDRDMFFHADQGNNCPTVKRKLDQLKKSPAIQGLEAQFRAQVYPQIVDIINRELGFNRISVQNLTIQTAKRVLDNYRCNSFHQVEHPNFNHSVLDLLERVRYTFIYEILYKDSFIKAVAASKLLEDISNHMIAIKNGDTTIKSIFYIAHDHNIEALFSLLVEEEKLNDRKYFMVEFASVLSIEVHVEGEQNLHIKFFYNDEPLSVKFCKGNKCSLEDFQSYTEKILIQNLEQVCFE